MNDLTRLGVAAARGGDRVRARSLLKEAINSNEKDLVAWWWLAQVMDDPTVRHKCLEKARTIAAENEVGGQTYRELLEQSKAPRLSRYKVADRSRSMGDQCPICSVNIAAGDEIVVCPKCARGNHCECWEENVFHCGNFACDGSALVDRARPAVVETAAQTETIKVEEAEIPKESPQPSRETQEQGFMYRLQERMLQQALQQAAEKDLQEREVKERIEQLRKQLMQRTAKALVAGLILGVCLAVPAFRSSGSWLLALVTIYLAASAMRTAAAYSFMDSKQVTSILYWVLPQVIAAILMWSTFHFWRVAGSSVAVSIIAMLIIGRILKTRAFLERRNFIAYSGWLLLSLTLIRILA
jgi:hypothetical protein